MALTTVQQAVVDHLAAEPGPVISASAPGADGWVAKVRHGDGEGAGRATVQFVNSRAFPGCQLHYVEFAARERPHQHMLVRTWQQADGSWAAEPIGGSSGPPNTGPGPGSTSPHNGMPTSSPQAGR